MELGIRKDSWGGGGDGGGRIGLPQESQKGIHGHIECHMLEDTKKNFTRGIFCDVEKLNAYAEE